MLFWKKRPRSTRPDPQVVEAVRASGLFDAAWYLHAYPEVAAFQAGPLLHFCEYGLDEHREPGPNFSTQRYLGHRPEARHGAKPPFLLAIGEGVAATRPLWLSQDTETLRWLLERSGLFDPDWYNARNHDVRRSKTVPIDHFLKDGAAERRDPGPGFDTAAYVLRHPDWAAEAGSAIEHYLRIGQFAGEQAIPRADAEAGRSISYQDWIAAFDDLTEADLDRIRADGAAAALPPVFGLCLPDGDGRATGTPDQVGVRWQNGRPGDADETRADLARLPEGAIALIYGGQVRLRPHAAYVLASTLCARGGERALQAVYADHDLVDAAGTRLRPVLKPDMSPAFMERLPYAGPLAAFRIGPGVREAIAAALGSVGHADGGPRTDAAGSIARALLALDRDRVSRAPWVLYGLPGTGAPAVYDGFEPVPDAPPPPEAPDMSDEGLARVRIVIPTRDRAGILKAGIDSILAQTDYPKALFGITIVDNDSVEDETLAYFATLQDSDSVAVVRSPGAFNFAKICNDGAASTDAEVLVFLNNDMTVNRPDWLRRFMHHLRLPDVGIVGAQLLYPDEAVQHGGTVLGVQFVGAHRLHGADVDEAARIDVTREMVSVTGACLAVRRALFERLGGFDPALRVAFNDVKLCIDVHRAGYRNVYVAEPLFYHHESISRGHDDSRLKRQRNAREAIYVRERYTAILHDDPSYNPNLSLQRVGELARPPRRVRPWRRAEAGPDGGWRILLLSVTHDFGSGVAMVVAQQAAFLRQRGFKVFVGGPAGPGDITYRGCTRVPLRQPDELAAYAVSEAMDCVVAHTPPYFSLARYLGQRPLLYVYDHGEPFPHLFDSREEREDVDWEKRMCVAGVKRVFTISQAIFDQQYRADALVVRNGNSHLATWDGQRRDRRAALRETLGFAGRFVVLNVCRFGYEERFYKGIDVYIDLFQQVLFADRDLVSRVVFVLAGRGKEADVAYVEAGGLRVFANVSDAEMTDLYVAGDLYMNFSRWEGYNLGIGQARAMGLPVIASDIPAHREFGIPVSNSVAELVRLVEDAFRTWDAGGRAAIIEPWDVPLARFAQTLEDDLAEDRGQAWT
ncbi:glycosyltransferase [Methylobacterium trifolii]|uniref:Glycosyltransferase 2-like domain-containing protein n=1 Tax=Methylobacterium trifolii TaxID=1003092 RepID=A0ABQ4TXS8_9HYPH|nr:glycosyltransferase [Methylobacterium trifolii]GJE60043.1 hypothetical protein MPOCJGCO_2152 [Methylobacterium trifolii]